MKLLHVQRARSIWLFDIRDLNPRGKDITEDLIDWIKQAYNFSVAPEFTGAPAVSNPPTAFAGGPTQSDGLTFQRGRFQVQEDVFVEISSLSIFNDGIVIDTPSSTHDGDLFAKDLLESAARDFTLTYDPDVVRKQIYVSELIIRSDVDLDRVNQQLAGFAQRIAAVFSDEGRPEFRISGLSFWTEPNDAGRSRIFSLERQAGRAFKERRFYSQAPMQTNDHLALLEELERMLVQ